MTVGALFDSSPPSPVSVSCLAFPTQPKIAGAAGQQPALRQPAERRSFSGSRRTGPICALWELRPRRQARGARWRRRRGTYVRYTENIFSFKRVVWVCLYRMRADRLNMVPRTRVEVCSLLVCRYHLIFLFLGAPNSPSCGASNQRADDDFVWYCRGYGYVRRALSGGCCALEHSPTAHIC